jgi:hypothetical protein
MFLHCHQRTQRRLDLLTIAIDELVEDLYAAGRGSNQSTQETRTRRCIPVVPAAAD